MYWAISPKLVKKSIKLHNMIYDILIVNSQHAVRLTEYSLTKL